MARIEPGKVEPDRDAAIEGTTLMPSPEEIGPPVSPFTTTAHRLATDSEGDARLKRQMEAEDRAKADAARGGWT
jgi:hypothetical protein